MSDAERTSDANSSAQSPGPEPLVHVGPTDDWDAIDRAIRQMLALNTGRYELTVRHNAEIIVRAHTLPTIETDIPIARRVAENMSRASVELEGTSFPEIATMLRVASNTVERALRDIEHLQAGAPLNDVEALRLELARTLKDKVDAIEDRDAAAGRVRELEQRLARETPRLPEQLPNGDEIFATSNWQVKCAGHYGEDDWLDPPKEITYLVQNRHFIDALLVALFDFIEEELEDGVDGERTARMVSLSIQPDRMRVIRAERV